MEAENEKSDRIRREIPQHCDGTEKSLRTKLASFMHLSLCAGREATLLDRDSTLI